MDKSHSSSERASQPSRAELVFLDYLKRLEGGEELDFEQLCSAHAEIEHELRGLQEDQAWAKAMGLEERFTSGTKLHGGAGESDNGAAEEDDPLVGELFHLKYRIVRRIGRGGFGTVYEATDERGAGNPVAIKVLSGAAAESVAQKQSFKDEARRVTRLSHPNVVDWKVFDQTEEGLSYFVMELVQGEKFDQTLRREGRIEPERAARLLLQIADALHAAHHLSESESILHLDLKPDNLFLIPGQRGREEQMKVIDFGIGQYIGDEEVHEGGEAMPSARVSDSGPSTLTFVPKSKPGSSQSSKVKRSRSCTPEYASPEQVAHVMDKDEILPLDGRSDLYSLGVIGFQMLTGHLPFEARDNRFDVLRMHTEVPAPKLASMGVRAPKRITRFIERCLEKERERRWPDTQTAYEYLLDIVHPPVWKAVAKVTVPLVLAGAAFGTWVVVNREVPVTVASLLTEDGADLDLRSLYLGPERPTATLRLAVPGGELPAASGTWSVVRAEDGQALGGWEVTWAGADRLTLTAPENLSGRLQELVQLQLDADRLHTRTFTAVWIGAETWSVPAVEIAGRPVEELAGLGIDPFGIALDVWIEGASRADVAAVGVRKSTGEHLTLRRGTGVGERERYRLGLEDAGLVDGANALLLQVRDAAGGEWARDLKLEILREQLAFSDLELVDAAGKRSQDGDLPRCNRSAGRYVISPRTQATLSIRLSRAADVSWAVFTEGSSQPALRSSSTGRQRLESDLADLAGLAGGQPYEGRLHIVAREDDYVLHGEGSTRGLAEKELSFRYENTEPRFTAHWVASGVSRALAPSSGAAGTDGSLVFTNLARADVLITRQDPVPMKIDVAWWPAGRPEAARSVESSELRNLQTQQTKLHVELDSDGRYDLRVRSYRYDTSADEVGEFPDVETITTLVLDRAAPDLVLAGIEDGQVVADAGALPTGVDVRSNGLSAGDEGTLDLRWSLRRLAAGAPWSASGELLGQDPRAVARIVMARPWVDDADGRYRLELEGNDQAGNALSGKAVEFEVSLRGPEIELEQPSGVGKWHANAVTGRWRVRARARDANGVEQVACELLSGVDESSTAIALEPEAGSSRSEKVFDGALLLPYTLSDERVRLRFTASDGHGTKTVWTSEELELPSIARPRPERIAVQFGGRDVEPMRLVRGNAEYPYLFGGRGDAIENSAFVRAGVGPFNSSPRKSRTRSWQIEYSAGAIEDFYLDEREVSVSQYLAFVRDPGGYADARNWREDGPDSARVEELGADLAELPGDRPVTNVTWPEASAYARWVHKRLPAWVEWEFAVRGGGEYRISSAQDPSVGEWMEAAKSSAPLSRGNSGDWTPDEKLADLCANVAEWTSTAASFESEDDRRYPHRWARAHPERLLPQATADEGIEYWIAGGSYMDQRFDFAVVDYRPSRFAHPAIGFRCAVSLRDVQASLGQAVAGGPFFEEAP